MIVAFIIAFTAGDIDRSKPRFAIGLIVASGSIGLLFPPSLPVILYGVVSHVPIDELFIAGAIPGAVLVLLLVGMAVYQAVRAFELFTGRPADPNRMKATFDVFD